MIVTIRLPGATWRYDTSARLGREGGFGIVFRGTDDEGAEVAIKRLKLEASDAAHRELRVANELLGGEFEHVLGVLDAGRDANSDAYFVVMPLAQGSLQDELAAHGPHDDGAAASILLQISEGLGELPALVHRDLKPDNVLLHDGRWKIADFGIARFVEESTSLETLKGFLTPQYAAPEQWRLERATPATDIYALGCIAFTLLTGSPPFSGPTKGDFRRQHLGEEPLPISGGDPMMQSLVSMMLRKRPEARPSLPRVLEILRRIAQPSGLPTQSAGLKELAEVAAADATRRASEEARRAAVEAAERERQSLADEAYGILKSVVSQLLDEITIRAPTARHIAPRSSSSHVRVGVVLGNATLLVEYIDGAALQSGRFAQSGWDVVARGVIIVKQPEPEYEWSASLWYVRLPGESGYRWCEVSYYGNPLAVHVKCEPFALDNLDDADMAAAKTVARYCIAWGPHPIDDEAVTDFSSRWAGLLARACSGKLRHPSAMPLE